MIDISDVVRVDISGGFEITFLIFLIDATLNSSWELEFGVVFLIVMLEIRSIKPLSFPAKCFTVNLKGSSLSTKLVSLVWYVLFPRLLDNADNRALWSVITSKSDPYK